jgi:tRNA1Val (adenine37-N6)-methyltransferase
MDVTLDSIRDIKLYQSKTGYRFSVDSLLLYDFITLKEVTCIADLGAGSGIVGILLAKKYTGAFVTLLEIQDDLVRIAGKNILLNHVEDRVSAVKCDLRVVADLCVESRSCDLVVSNPPFRRLRSGLLNIEEERAIARHEIKLRLPEFIDAASRLLKAKGRLCMIYHPQRLSELMAAMRHKDIEPKRLRFVHSTVMSESKMVLLEGVKGGRTGLKVEKPLFIYKKDGGYSDDMEAIYT